MKAVACVLAVAAGAMVSGLMSTSSNGHQGHAHVPEKAASQPATAASSSKTNDAPKLPDALVKALAFPSKIGGDFELIDQAGAKRSLKDFAGKPIAIFFGYATCEAICSVALPRMAELIDKLEAKKIEVQPVLITVDPKRDTPHALREALPKYHKKLVGLTGTQAQIDKAQAAFQVESKVVYVDPDGGEIYAHGSYIYLMDSDGEFLTLFPPILGPERMATIAEKYLKASPS